MRLQVTTYNMISMRKQIVAHTFAKLGRGWQRSRDSFRGLRSTWHVIERVIELALR